MALMTGIREGHVTSGLEALRDFWGVSNGSEVAASTCRSELRKLKLRQSELHELRDTLPGVRVGTTGERVVRVDRMLKRLEKEG